MILDDVTKADLDALKKRLLAQPFKPYKKLNAIEQILVANGCGGKSSIINPPDFTFGCSCNDHDTGYFYGGDKKRRKYLDKKFHQDMKESIRLSSKSRLRKFGLRVLAWIYYIEVRRHGAKFFNFRTGVRL